MHSVPKKIIEEVCACRRVDTQIYREHRTMCVLQKCILYYYGHCILVAL
jgi:hypothetical protein